MRNILIILSIFLFSGNAIAAPSTPSAQSNIQHGASVTVTGTNFGTKATAAPLLWDSIDGSYAGITNGGVVPVGSSYPWMESSGDYDVHFKTTNPRGKWTAKYTNTGSTSVTDKAGLGGRYFPGTTVLYTSWWLYVSANACISSDKWNRYFTSDYSGQIIWQPVSKTIYQEGNVDYTTWEDPTCGNPGYWQRMEEIVDSTASPYPAVYMAVDNEPNASQPLNSNGSISGNINLVGAIGYDSSNEEGTQRPTIDWGEIYIDNTRARVEICNNSVKANATHCEIQIPSAWDGVSATNSITFTVNQGSFADDSSAYLFIIDPVGDASAAGELVTFSDGEADATAPATTISTSDPSAISSDALTITGTASDAVGVSGCKYRLGSAPDGSNGTACTGTTSFSCSTSGYSSGTNTMHVACYDAAGNYGDDSITVNYTPPAVTAALTGGTCLGCTIRN